MYSLMELVSASAWAWIHWGDQDYYCRKESGAPMETPLFLIRLPKSEFGMNCKLISR
jgi:hypothetical protein